MNSKQIIYKSKYAIIDHTYSDKSDIEIKLYNERPKYALIDGTLVDDIKITVTEPENSAYIEALEEMYEYSLYAETIPDNELYKYHPSSIHKKKKWFNIFGPYVNCIKSGWYRMSDQMRRKYELRTNNFIIKYYIPENECKEVIENKERTVI
jgi:hypothetical protein